MDLYPKEKLQPDWVTKGIQRNTVIWAEGFAKYLVDKRVLNANGEIKRNNRGEIYIVEPLTTTQIRRFFGEIKRISNSIDFSEQKDAIIMLKPQLAYAVGRAKNKEDKIKDFYEQMAIALDAIRLDDEEHCQADFRNFVKIYEAVVAYHKANNGK